MDDKKYYIAPDGTLAYTNGNLGYVAWEYGDCTEHFREVQGTVMPDGFVEIPLQVVAALRKFDV